MPPRKKKQRTAVAPEKDELARGAAMADVLVADAGVAHSINDVPQLQRSVCQCVEVLYGLRHGTTSGQPVPGPASIPDASLSELGRQACRKQ